MSTADTTDPTRSRENDAISLRQKLLSVMKAVGPIPKDETNPHGGYAYRGIDGAMAALQPALADAGVILQPILKKCHVERFQAGSGTPMASARVRVAYTLLDCDSTASLTVVFPGMASDAQDRAVAQAMSDAFKLFVFQTFVSPPEGHESDPERSHGEPVPTQPPPNDPRDRMPEPPPEPPYQDDGYAPPGDPGGPPPTQPPPNSGATSGARMVSNPQANMLLARSRAHGETMGVHGYAVLNGALAACGIEALPTRCPDNATAREHLMAHVTANRVDALLPVIEAYAPGGAQ